ncbi:MAG: hypothetical protein J6S23_04130 [Clostridia bacterium]|nr:hypothetical protein [Clostridia bacterium]
MENYLMLNGKRIDLTAEQIETLVGKKEKDPFERVEGETFFYIDVDGCVEADEDCLTSFDNDYYAAGNYCTDKELMEQRALHVILNQLLWRYSMQHGGREIDCLNNEIPAWYIRNEVGVLYAADWCGNCGIGEIAFRSEEAADAAIEKIVNPFMEKHPEFRW